jgi:dipeptidyl-peptidase-4
MLVGLISSAAAQKKDFTLDQLFHKKLTDFTKPFPDIQGWADDEHYLEMRNNKLMSIEVKTGKAISYTPPAEASVPEVKDAKNITLSPDGKWIGYTKQDNNLYAKELATGKEIQFTSDGSDVILNGYASWVYYEEILGRPSKYRSFWWSPDSKHIAFMKANDSEVPMFPIYFSEGQYGSIEKTHYPKAGDKNPEIKIGVVSVNDPAIIWTDFDEKNDQYFGMPYWTPGGELWIQWMPRSQDNLKIYTIDIANGSKKEIYNENQKTWINLDDNDRVTFIPGTNYFLLRSDRTGWMHLYLHDLSGKLINPVTQGNFTVNEIIKTDAKAKLVYFTARKENSTRVDLYKIGFNGKGLTRLTFGEYNNTVIASPNMKYFITIYSNLNAPLKMALVDAKGKMVREIADIKGKDFDNYNMPKTELVRVKSADSLFDLPMIIIYPTHFDANKKYPVLMSVYGGPDAGTVYDSWQGIRPVWLAQEGIIQVMMDNRSSGHFGKAGMNYIHRQLGKYEIEDFMQGARWLKQKPFVDGAKMCINGGSFGGYMTCMALTYGADVFNYGIASYSVTDWQLYDTHYTERYMDAPQENPKGYDSTSVMKYVDKYKGLLRIVHGTTDDNVHLQNSLQLINKLENLNKHFELMLYPGERHGWGGNKAKHSSYESYLFYYKNLLNKEMPAGLFTP